MFKIFLCIQLEESWAHKLLIELTSALLVLTLDLINTLIEFNQLINQRLLIQKRNKERRWQVNFFKECKNKLQKKSLSIFVNNRNHRIFWIWKMNLHSNLLILIQISMNLSGREPNKKKYSNSRELNYPLNKIFKPLFKT